MSNRTNVFSGGSKNPATKFLEWKSDQKGFSYYDKGLAKNVEVSLPFKFVFLDELSTVKGWNDSSSSGIFANEVKYLSEQPMTVKAFKGGVLAQGLYNEIKERVKNAGGHYSKSIYIMLEDGALANIQLKGSAVQGWGEFVKLNREKMKYSWVNVASATENKKGKVVYSVPNFIIGNDMDAPTVNNADGKFDELEAYLKTYLAKVDVAEIEVEAEEEMAF
ncbi:MAG: phage Gaia [Bacteroidota bacterium]|jgi:hypothetical protein